MKSSPNFDPRRGLVKPSARKRDEGERNKAEPYRAWYKLAVWVKGRLSFIAEHPWCERCLRDGRHEPTTVVNHRIPHKGDWSLFIDRANWEAACIPHHEGEIKREERSGRRFKAGWVGGG